MVNFFVKTVDLETRLTEFFEILQIEVILKMRILYIKATVVVSVCRGVETQILSVRLSRS
jgi:hypothetical protein